MPMTVRPAIYLSDEGGPLAAEGQAPAANHPKLLWLNSRVVSVGEKAGRDPVRYESVRGTKVNHP